MLVLLCLPLLASRYTGTAALGASPATAQGASLSSAESRTRASSPGSGPAANASESSHTNTGNHSSQEGNGKVRVHPSRSESGAKKGDTSQKTGGVSKPAASSREFSQPQPGARLSSGPQVVVLPGGEASTGKGISPIAGDGTPAGASTGTEGPEAHAASTKDSGLRPPESVRAMLVLPASDQPMSLPRLRVQWNPSPSDGIEHYRVSLWVDGQLLQEDTVPASQWFWVSQGLELQQPGPLVQVQAERGLLHSDPVRLVDYPLHLRAAALLQPQGAGETLPGQNELQTPKSPPLPLSHAPLQPTLPPGTIRAIAFDPDGEHLWVGTGGGGLARFSPSSGESQWFSSVDGLAGDDVAGLLISQHGGRRTLWIATDGGLSQIELSDPQLRIQSFAYNRTWFRDLMAQQPGINAISEDNQGRILLGTHTDGLLVFDPVKREGWQRTSSDGLLTDIIWSILPDPHRPYAWLGTSDGMQNYALDSSPAPSELTPPREPASLQVPIRGLARTQNGLLLLNPDVLYFYGEAGQQPQKLHAFIETEAPLQNSMVISKNGEVWIATLRGLRRYRFGQTPQEFRRLELALPPSLPSPPRQTDKGMPRPVPPVTEPDLSNTPDLASIALASDGSLWLGMSNGRGLVHYQPETGQSDTWPSSPLQIFRSINAIARDGQNHIWLGTDVGPMRIDPDARTLKPMTQVGLNSLSPGYLPPTPIYTLTPDQEGSIFLGHACSASAALTLGCVTRYEPNNGFQPFLPSDMAVRELQAVRVALLKDEDLYLAFQRNGLRVFFASSGNSYAAHQIMNISGALTDRQVSSLAVDDSGIWVGTEQGLYYFRTSQPSPDEDLKPGTNQRLQPPQGMPEQLRSAAINAMLVEPSGVLWVGTDNGLWRRSRTQDREFWQQVFGGSVDRATRTLFIDPQQRLWIGTTQGLYRSAPLTGLDTALSTEPFKLLADHRIQAIFVDEDGIAWVGTDRGLMVVPPIRAPARENPMRQWLPWLGLGLLALVALLMWTLKPSPRNPLVDSLEEDPLLLPRIPLANLTELAAALNSSHRLSLVLLRLELDQARWQRIERTAGLWPRGGQALPPDQVELLVLQLANLLGAEILPTSAFRRKLSLEISAQPFSPVPDYPLDDSGVWLSPQQVAPSDQSPEGFDLGAPGIEEWRGRPTEQGYPPAEGQAASPAPGTRNLAERDRSGEIPSPMPAQAPESRALKATSSGYKQHPHEVGGVENSPPLLFILRLPDLPIRLVQREVPLVVIRSRFLDDNPAAGLLKLVREVQTSHRYVMLLNLVPSWTIPPLNVPGTRFIPLNEEDVRGILYSRKVETTFVQHILKHVKLTEVSPYSSKGEVANPEMFVGRKFELDRIISSEKANFSIVGARQIGKSSLMGALKRHYRNEGRREVYSITLTLQEDSLAFYRRISMLLKKNRVPRTSNEFAEMMELHHREQLVPALFLIDEVDGLLARERQQGYPVLTAMRRLQQQDICWFILAGYWELVRLGNDYHSPLYNMSEVIELGPLKQDDALTLIDRPMEKMGLRFENEALMKEIVSLTAGHPHLIQFFCNQLLERMTATRRPVFSAADVLAVRNSDEVKTYVTRNFKANAGLLDEVIVYSTIASLRFNHPQLAEALQKLGVNVAPRMREESVNKLKLVGILREEDGRFEYALPIFREALLKEDLTYFAATRAQELKEER